MRWERIDGVSSLSVTDGSDNNLIENNLQYSKK